MISIEPTEIRGKNTCSSVKGYDQNPTLEILGVGHMAYRYYY